MEDIDKPVDPDEILRRLLKSALVTLVVDVVDKCKEDRATREQLDAAIDSARILTEYLL